MGAIVHRPVPLRNNASVEIGPRGLKRVGPAALYAGAPAGTGTGRGNPCVGAIEVGRAASYMSPAALEVQLSQPVIVSIPHHLGREEAARRIKSGLAAARTNYSALLNIREETWNGDSLVFNMSTFGQSAAGRIDIADDHVRLEVTLPWLLAKFAEKLTPAIRKEATLMLEKK